MKKKKELIISTQPDIDTLNRVNTAAKCCREISIRKIFCDTQWCQFPHNCFTDADSTDLRRAVKVKVCGEGGFVTATCML